MAKDTTTPADALSGDFGAFSHTAGYISRGNVRFEYNGTTLDMVFRALEAGARVGDELLTPGLSRSIVCWRLIPTGGGLRTRDGIWAEVAKHGLDEAATLLATV
jgi:hypothetical protein